MIAKDALGQAIGVLNSAGIEAAPGDARRLLAAAMDIEAGRLALHLDEPLTPSQMARFQATIDRRARREPISHILGMRSFFDHTFEVGPDVLDPRPETEILVRAALERPFMRVLDLGIGSGAILLSLLAKRKTDVFGIGTDLSTAALAVAGRNAARIGVADRLRLYQGDWFAALPSFEAPFDLIVSNPPYITAEEMLGLSKDVTAYEPRMALTDEADGLTFYRKITAGACDWLAPGGWLMVEIGPTQASDVAEMLESAGFQSISVLTDFDGRNRVVLGENPQS